jgi:ribosome assembly protein RRB1
MAESEDFEMESDGNSRSEDEKKVKIYLPGQPLKEDEELVCDESTYIMLHEVQTGKKSKPRGFRVQIHG